MQNSLGQKIRKIREIRGYSQEYMAKKLGFTQEQYSYLENRQKTITEEKLNTIANLFNVTADYLKEFNANNIFSTQSHDRSNKTFYADETLSQSHENEKKVYQELILQLKQENTFLKNLLDNRV